MSRTFTISAVPENGLLSISLLLVGLAPSSAMPFNGLLQRSLASGERLTYVRTSTMSASGTFHKHHIRYIITVTSDDGGSISKEPVGPADGDLRGVGTFGFRFNQGEWALEDGTPQYDFGFDYRLYCAQPAKLVPGMTWGCDVPGIVRWSPAGHVDISVLSVQGDAVILNVVGVSQPVHGSQVDTDTGKEYSSVTRSKWHERLTFEGGLLKTCVRDFDTEMDIANLQLPSHAHEEISLEFHSKG